MTYILGLMPLPWEITYYVVYLFTYSSSSHPSLCIRPLSNFRYFTQYLAAFFVIVQEFHPSWFLSASTVLHGDFGHPLFQYLSGPWLMLFFLFPSPMFEPIHLHHLIFISSDIRVKPSCLYNSSFDTFVGP